MRYQFRVIIGMPDQDPFTELRNIVHEIFSSARLLAQLWPRRERVNAIGIEAAIGQLEADIDASESVFWQKAIDDAISRDVDAVVARMERLCGPVLSPVPWYSKVFDIFGGGTVR